MLNKWEDDQENEIKWGKIQLHERKKKSHNKDHTFVEITEKSKNQIKETLILQLIIVIFVDIQMTEKSRCGEIERQRYLFKLEIKIKFPLSYIPLSILFFKRR